jgi:release factor glutamine methyltransferase
MNDLSSESFAKILAWSIKQTPPEIAEAMAVTPGADEWLRRTADALSTYVTGAPLGYVLGEVSYLGRTFRCDSRALVIRPYNELIVRQVMSDWAGRQPRVLEIGCGAGAMIISLALELAGEFTGTDIDSAALELARENAVALRASLLLHQSNLFASVNGEFDVILANLPWEDPARVLPEAAWEPDQALYDRSGVQFGIIRQFLAEAPLHLRPNGFIYLEVSTAPEQQACFVGLELTLPDGEVIGRKMTGRQATESAALLGAALKATKHNEGLRTWI